MALKSLIYALLRLMNDFNAAKRGKIPRRIARRTAGKATGRLFRRL